MNDQQVEAQAPGVDELEALALQAVVALVEERVIENLTRIIERLARERSERGT